MIADGHIHTPFCPHGTSDRFEEYIEWAINHHLEEISFTEHAPLPDDFIDTTPTKDSAMTHDQISEYIEKTTLLKEKYKEFLDYIWVFENKIHKYYGKKKIKIVVVPF